MHDIYDTFDEDEFDGPSKTQIKKEMHELQELGVKLTELTLEQISRLPLTEELYNAITEAPKITQRSAKKRHMQFIGKLMRKADGDAIREAYDEIQEAQHQAARQLHLIEKWRDRLADGDNQALQNFIQEYPHADIQQLRQLIRQVQKETSQQKAPAAKRKLFKLIRETLSVNH
ncbi:ribosome biogenesis factor YjgA [Teredinibacter sp. KSP-S5-2]|uniref:ribosome biogenesis factor YjgA n=1 Tax=Teredinibacter sp. KSP-S5-2 TaxID=3034506 RepID=UPI002934576C|nr:ribosome biogenesis factor YjgA [Teredinibacter sp. KSP-S5-2]WNO09582.1 ribosome biogenesis factor YjgA [Teredinibacter sp. KSP-S5-2]